MKLEKTFPIYTKIHASGNVGWRVDMGYIQGKRRYIGFPTEADAKRHQKRCLELQAKQRPADLRDLSESMRHEVLAALAKLRAHNATITQAVDYFLKHARPASANATLGEVMEEFRKAKLKAGMSHKYIKTSRDTFFEPFKKHFKDCFISEITSQDCEDYIFQSKKWNATTQRSHIRHLSVLFNFAVDKGFLAYNPIEKVTKPKRPPSTSRERVVTVDNAIKILQFALKHGYKSECAALVLMLFCGVRTEEVARLDWDDIKLDDETPVVNLYEDITKTGKSRINLIPDNALEWLQLLRSTGPVAGPKYEGRMRYLRKKANADFLQNSARISFASYHLARFEDAPKTAFLLGHDNPTLLYNTYKALVTKAESERYWSITPTYAGVVEQYEPTQGDIDAARAEGILKALRRK